MSRLLIVDDEERIRVILKKYAEFEGYDTDEAADGIGDGGILLYPPVVDLQVIVYQILVVEQSGVDVADLFPLFAVENVGLGHIRIAGLGEDFFHTVLDILYGDAVVFDLLFKICRYMQSKQIQHTGMGLLVQGIKCLADGSTYLGNVELYQLTVPFNDSIHKKSPAV